jgi:hypothetical protein
MNPLLITTTYFNYKFLWGRRWWRAKIWVIVLSFYSISDSTQLKHEYDYFKLRLVPPREHAASPCVER